MVALALGHAGGNGTDADLGDQFDADAGVRGHIFQVMDELGQIFNRVDVVVGRWRDQTDAWHAIAQLADVLGHLAAGQLAAFAGLGALRHLDLNLVRAGQIIGGHAKATRGHLLDARAQTVTVVQGQIDLDLLLADDAFEGFALFDRDRKSTRLNSQSH